MPTPPVSRLACRKAIHSVETSSNRSRARRRGFAARHSRAAPRPAGADRAAHRAPTPRHEAAGRGPVVRTTVPPKRTGALQCEGTRTLPPRSSCVVAVAAIQLPLARGGPRESRTQGVGDAGRTGVQPPSPPALSPIARADPCRLPSFPPAAHRWPPRRPILAIRALPSRVLRVSKRVSKRPSRTPARASRTQICAFRTRFETPSRSGSSLFLFLSFFSPGLGLAVPVLPRLALSRLPLLVCLVLHPSHYPCLPSAICPYRPLYPHLAPPLSPFFLFPSALPSSPHAPFSLLRFPS